MRHIGKEVPTAVAVAPDELDALGEPVGHRIELDGEFADLRRSGTELGGRHAPRQVALSERARSVGQLPDRVREPAGECGRYHDRQTEREQTDRDQEARHVVDRGRPIRVGIRERDLHGVLAVRHSAGDIRRHRRSLARLSGRRRISPVEEHGPIRRLDEVRRARFILDRQPISNDDVGLREAVGDRGRGIHWTRAC